MEHQNKTQIVCSPSSAARPEFAVRIESKLNGMFRVFQCNFRTSKRRQIEPFRDLRHVLDDSFANHEIPNSLSEAPMQPNPH